MKATALSIETPSGKSSRLEEWVKTNTTRTEPVISEEESSNSLLDLYNDCIIAWKALCGSIYDQEKVRFQQTLGRFSICQDFLTLATVEILILHDNDFALAIVSLLRSTASSLLEVYKLLFNESNDSDDQKPFKNLKHKLDQTQCLEEDNSPASEDNESVCSLGFEQQAPTQSLEDTLSSLETYSKCLLELEPSVEKARLEYSQMFGDPQSTSMSKVNERKIPGPAAAFARMILDAHNAADPSLVEYLAEANWQRSVRLRIARGSRFCFSCKREKLSSDLDHCLQCYGQTFCKEGCAECAADDCHEPRHVSCWELHLPFDGHRRRALHTSVECQVSETQVKDDVKLEDVKFEEVAELYFGETTTFHDSGFGSSLPVQSQYAESLASTASEAATGSARVPPTPKEVAMGKAFTCQFCLKNIDYIHNRSEWKKHVFSDLQSYVCCHLDCRDNYITFRNRNELYQHESIIHPGKQEYQCSACETITLSPSDWLAHVKDAHSITFYNSVAEKSALANAVRRGKDGQREECPICKRKLDSIKGGLQTHIAKHLETISLASVPANIKDDQESDIDASEVSSAEGEIGEHDHSSVVPHQNLQTLDQVDRNTFAMEPSHAHTHTTTSEGVLEKENHRSPLRPASQYLGFDNRDQKQDYLVFVDNLGPEVSEYMLRSLFQERFASCKFAKVQIDPISGMCYGQGVVGFSNKEEEIRALTEMQGVYCGSRPIEITKGYGVRIDNKETYSYSANLTEAKKREDIPVQSHSSGSETMRQQFNQSLKNYLNSCGQTYSPGTLIGDIWVDYFELWDLVVHRRILERGSNHRDWVLVSRNLGISEKAYPSAPEMLKDIFHVNLQGFYDLTAGRLQTRENTEARDDTQILTPPDISVPSTHDCNDCEPTLTSKAQWESHLNEEHDRLFICNHPSCSHAGSSHRFSTSAALKRHKSARHGDYSDLHKYYICAAESCATEPKKIWPRADNFRAHVKRIHKDEDQEALIQRSKYVANSIESVTAETSLSAVHQKVQDLQDQQSPHQAASNKINISNTIQQDQKQSANRARRDPYSLPSPNQVLSAEMANMPTDSIRGGNAPKLSTHPPNYRKRPGPRPQYSDEMQPPGFAYLREIQKDEVHSEVPALSFAQPLQVGTVKEKIFARLSQQPQGSQEWQQRIQIEERAHYIHELITQMRLEMACSEHSNSPRSMRILESATEFERDVFEQAPTDNEYVNNILQKLGRIRLSRQRRANEMQISLGYLREPE